MGHGKCQTDEELDRIINAVNDKLGPNGNAMTD